MIKGAPRVKMLNAYVHDISMDELVRDFDEGLLLTLHVDMAMKLQQDPEFHAIIDQFDVITCDSQIMSTRDLVAQHVGGL